MRIACELEGIPLIRSVLSLENDEPGSNAVEHQPDPEAKPIPDGEHKYVPRSPYTTGNY